MKAARAHVLGKDETALYEPVQYHGLDMALGLIEDDVMPHQLQHLELVSNIERLLGFAPICNRQADQATAGTNLESACVPQSVPYSHKQTGLRHAAYSTAGGIRGMYPLVRSM